jgi:hypothetical protein
MDQGNCTHTDEERCIFGRWVVDMFRNAIEMGYILGNVFEFWEYEITCFNRGTNSIGLFAEYVNMFLKLKQESSGYPAWVQSEADKDNYIEDYRRAELLLCTRHQFPKMQGKGLAKLKLNSMWENGLNQNKTQTTLVTSVNVIRAPDKSVY